MIIILRTHVQISIIHMLMFIVRSSLGEKKRQLIFDLFLGNGTPI